MDLFKTYIVSLNSVSNPLNLNHILQTRLDKLKKLLSEVSYLWFLNPQTILVWCWLDCTQLSARNLFLIHKLS